MEGVIVKATGGFYYVETGEGEPLECRALGVFRKEGHSPYVGDHVEARRNEDGSGTILRILPRKNALVRPPLSNLDYMVVVLSVTDPAPNYQTTDKLLAMLEYQNIEPLIAVTKGDLEDPELLADLYRGAGYEVFVVNSRTGEGVDAITKRVAGSFSAFCGNSGVGKSSLLNAIDSRLSIQVGVTSKKLGRGRHTTRHVESFGQPGGGRLADTPGFSSLSLLQVSAIRSEELAECFREFRPFVSKCRFADCAHVCEVGCGVLQALKDGQISPIRHQSYVQLYEELRDVKDWERRR